MVYFKGRAAIVTAPPRLSIAIPVFNEEQVVPELLARLRRVLNDIPGGPHELVFVDDGSADRTFEMLADGGRGRIRASSRSRCRATSATRLRLPRRWITCPAISWW